MKCYIEGCYNEGKYSFTIDTPCLCFEHKLAGMTDIEKPIIFPTKKCYFSGCSYRGRYYLPGIKIALFCKIHKTQDMIETRSVCYFYDCMRESTYGYPFDNCRISCSIHKIEGMINMTKNCCEMGCKKIAKYDYPGNLKGSYCEIHKEKEMVNVRKTYQLKFYSPKEKIDSREELLKCFSQDTV